jgi:iron complex outermembrane recepter protein
MKNLYFIIVFFIANVFNYAQTVTGIITDSNTGLPIEFVNVVEENPLYHTTSDADGRYILQFSKSGTYTIYCKHLGYNTLKKKVQLGANENKTLHFSLDAHSEELSEIVLEATTSPAQRAGDALYTGVKITPKGIELLGASASNSILNTLSIIPSVSYQATDAYGLSEKSVRIRGVRNMFSGVTLEGIPNYGIMPIGARDDVFDMENVQNITLYKGATPVDILAATGNRGGTVDMTYKRPMDKFGFDAAQSIGDDQYSRTFLRFDTGKIAKKIAVFGSYSFTKADKWKGNGVLGERNHYMTGLDFQLSNSLKFELLGNWNEVQRHHFKPLKYALIEALDENYLLDFNSNLTGTPSNDVNYFDYNKGNYKNFQSVASLVYQNQDVASGSLKFYYNKEDACYQNSLQSGTQFLVQDKARDLNQWGIIMDYKGTFGNLKYGLGYWMESFDNNVNVYNHTITAVGLTPKGYAFYTVPEGRGQVHSPFLKLSYIFNNFKLQFGIKYLYFNEPESERFLALNAQELKPNPEPDLHTDAIIQSAFLPSFGIGYQVNENMELYANYGKNYMRPYMYVPVVSLYLQNRAAFTAQSMTLQSIFDQWEMETSDNIDLGIQWKNQQISVNTTLFYNRQNNTLTTILDPTVNVNYAQNVGDMTSYGAEIESNIKINKFLNWFVNPSYSRIYFDNNIEIKSTSGATILEIANNQAPATPVWMLKTGAMMQYKVLKLNTLVNYTGERFGDATNIERIPDFWLWDASLSYQFKFNGAFKGFTLGAEMKNILDTKYVGIIDVSDDSQNGSATYYTGYPQTFVASLKMDF